MPFLLLLHRDDIFCLHANVIPSASKLCKHLEIVLIDFCLLFTSRSDWSSSSPPSLLRGCHQARVACFSSVLWLIYNYSISVKIWSWPTLSRGANSPLLQFIKWFLFLCSAASLLNALVYELASCKLRLMWRAGNQSRAELDRQCSASWWKKLLSKRIVRCFYIVTRYWKTALLLDLHYLQS